MLGGGPLSRRLIPDLHEADFAFPAPDAGVKPTLAPDDRFDQSGIDGVLPGSGQNRFVLTCFAANAITLHEGDYATEKQDRKKPPLPLSEITHSDSAPLDGRRCVRLKYSILEPHYTTPANQQLGYTFPPCAKVWIRA